MSVPNKEFLEGSERLWKDRHTEAQGVLEARRSTESHWYHHWKALAEYRPDDDPHRVAAWHDYDKARQEREETEAERDKASVMLKLRRKQLEAYATSIYRPQLVGWDRSKLNPKGVFGPLGDEKKVTPHYAASPRAHNLAEGIKLARGFDRFHRGKGWGGVSYHYLIPDTGEIILGRSTYHKGAHVLNTNYGNVGINFFCTAGHQPTEAQAKSYLWLLANAHTDAMPKRHRTDRDLRKADIRGHNQWPGQSTGCPGNFTPSNLKAKGQ